MPVYAFGVTPNNAPVNLTFNVWAPSEEGAVRMASMILGWLATEDKVRWSVEFIEIPQEVFVRTIIERYGGRG